MSGKRGAWLSRNRLWVGKAVGFGVMRCTRIKFHQQPSLRQLQRSLGESQKATCRGLVTVRTAGALCSA